MKAGEFIILLISKIAFLGIITERLSLAAARDLYFASLWPSVQTDTILPPSEHR